MLVSVRLLSARRRRGRERQIIQDANDSDPVHVMDDMKRMPVQRHQAPAWTYCLR